MKVGEYEIYGLLLDRFRLDGGAMFGAVPKNLWEKRIRADEQNRIQLGCRALVIRSVDRFVVVELGCGDKWDSKQREIYKFEPQLSPPLSARNLPITDIVLTHLHFDHCGGISSFDESGAPILNFPQASVYVQEKNWERANNPGPRERATYLPANVKPLGQAKLILTTDGEEILPGIRVFQANGHTDGLQWLLIGSGAGAVAFPSDLIPTAHHVPVPYLMGYDLCASTTMREKEAFLEQAVREGWWVAFGHDADTAVVKVGKDAKGGYTAVETGTLPELKV